MVKEVPVIFFSSKGNEGDAMCAELPIDPGLSVEDDQFLNDHAENLLGAVDRCLRDHPPQLPEHTERKMALLLLDGVLHDPFAQARPPVQAFFRQRVKRVIEEIENTTVTDGARIWKIYSHSFVVRTAAVTIGFDLVRAAYIHGFNIAEPLMERLISQCDLHLVTHHHKDHADEWVVESFLNQGKVVVAPTQAFQERSIHSSITHLEREAHTIRSLVVSDRVGELKLVVYPGHQSGSTVNNVYLVRTPEGLSFMHTGDQSHDPDFVWIDEVAAHHHVDVLIPNCWTTDIVRVSRGINPNLIITGHENEMSHTISHREPFWLTYQRKVGSARWGGDPNVGYHHPLLPLAWGEGFHYRLQDYPAKHD